MITLEQIRAARAMLGLKQQELAAKAGISIGTLNNVERGVQADPKLSTLRSIRQALEAEGIAFTDSVDGGIGVRLKKQSCPERSTILIIDDNDADRILFKTWLHKQDNRQYTIIEAGNAKDGYEEFLNCSRIASYLTL